MYLRQLEMELQSCLEQGTSFIEDAVEAKIVVF